MSPVAKAKQPRRTTAPSPSTKTSLAEYQAKRNFAKTPEPQGGGSPNRARSTFAVQKHDASRLHYDFRLEMDGVLKSWAIPKGPSLDPADKRLAMQTEDHPLEYGGFEGVIPEGEYGGGTVLLWDRGVFRPESDPAAGLRAGRLKFTLAGEKLHGGWTLIRLRGRDRRDADGRSWLLIKERDEHARPSGELNLTEVRPESVLSGRGLEEIARAGDRTWHSDRTATSTPRTAGAAAPSRRAAATRGRGPIPWRAPCAAAGLRPAPAGDPDKGAHQETGGIHEMKFDGYRVLCRIANGRATLWSLNARDWTAQFPEIAAAAARPPARRSVADGEIAVLLPNGTTSFQAAAERPPLVARAGAAVYFVFDLLHLDGQDLTGGARGSQERAGGPDRHTRDGAIRYSTHVVGQGDEFFRQACRLSLEGW